MAAVISAKRVLNALSSDVYENDRYVFKSQGESFTLTAKDGRGEILSSRDGRIVGNLLSSEVAYLTQLERHVDLKEDVQGSGKETPQESTGR